MFRGFIWKQVFFNSVYKLVFIFIVRKCFPSLDLSNLPVRCVLIIVYCSETGPSVLSLNKES